MSNFVLVHGAWQSGWVWHRVMEQMEAAGDSQGVSRVLAPDLPGHGSRSADEIRRITVEHYVNSVVTEAQVERLEDIVLVGHGFAATFLPRVALELGDRVKRVVFIAGDLPPEGRSVYARLSPWDKMMLRVFKAEEKGFRFPDFISRRILAHGLDTGSRDQFLARMVPEPFLPWQTPVTRQGFDGKFPTAYIVLSRDRVIRPGLQRKYSRSLGSLQIEEISAGHTASLSHPREVVSALLKYAQ